MSITVAQIIQTAGRLLNDIDNTRWSAATLIEYANEAQSAIVTIKPDANPVTSVMRLVQGSKQTIPSGAVSLISVTRNMGNDGKVAGEAVTRATTEALSSLLPSWHTIQSGVVQKFTYDSDNKNVFYVFPAQPATTTYVEVIYSKRPTTLAAKTDNIELDDEYRSAIVNYIVYRAFSEEIDSPSSLALSQTYYGLFKEAVGAKMAAEQSGAAQ